MQTDRRFVADVDILGMRAMVRRDPEAAWSVLSGLARVREHVANLAFSRIETASHEFMAQRVQSVMFSDTITLFTKTEGNEDL